MSFFECVVKTAKDRNEKILWQAIYVNNKKETENYTIDLDKALKYFSPNNNWKEVIFTEDDVYSLLEDSFPEIEDFTYLLDYSTIDIGKTVYLPDGEKTVTKISNDYRSSGYYEVWHWEEIGGKYYGAVNNQYLQGHDVIKFQIEGSDEIYIWEDWNYHQSFLYLKYNEYNNGNKLVK